jgi:hypothetical protein
MMQKITFRGGFASFFANTIKEFSPRPRHIGGGQKRAAVRLYKHRVDQAIRVAAALPAFAEKRKLALAVRRARWMKDREDPQELLRAPRHIREG